jgi:hypothetical protein
VVLGGLLTFSVTGCGLVVDLDRFRDVSGGAAGPLALEEGAGGTPALGRGAPLLFLGGPFPAGLEVRADDARVTLSTPRLSEDGRALALLAWVAPFSLLDAGQTATVTLQLGEVSHPLFIQGLPELTLAGAVDPAALAPRYAEIRTGGAVTFTGAAPPRLEAAGAVILGHPVSVAALDDTPGPGGEPGGRAGAPGGGVRGGAAGADATGGCAGGGGGAGGSAAGTAGADGAAGGDGADGLDPSPLAAFAGHGGGGGGSTADATGRFGGGGGGAISVRGAVIQVRARLDARGGAGGSAAGSGCGQDGAGAGGGGAGGVIWLRAADALEGPGPLDVQGGPGGGGGQKAGGAGAAGFVRLEGPGSIPVVGEGALFRGPAWGGHDPRIEGPTALPFTAQPGAALRLTVDGAPQGDLTAADTGGEGTVQVDLPRGMHTVCLALASSVVEEEPACVRIAAL